MAERRRRKLTCSTCTAAPEDRCRVTAGPDAGLTLHDRHPARVAAETAPAPPKGRPAALSAAQVVQARTLISSGVPVARVAVKFDVSVATLYRYLKAAKG